MRVLIADDDLITLMALDKCLREWGYEVVIARNGLEAWEILNRDDSIQIIILDWMMPGLDGLVLTKRIKTELATEDHSARHIIILSGTDGYEEVIRGLSSGADDYLVKPYSFNELRVRLKRAEKMLALEEERRRLASFDPLTLLWNRRKIVDFLEEEIARGIRNFYPTGALLIGLSIPPSPSDSLSMEELENSLLQEMAHHLKDKIRRYDKAGRFSRREFLLILPQTSSAELKKIARRLSDNFSLDPAFKALGIAAGEISFGGASTDILSHPSAEGLIWACEKALNIARHPRYPESFHILEKKEVSAHDRRPDSR